MKINQSILGYCTNIHPGEKWPDHFTAIKENFPPIKRLICPKEAMGMGLRLSNTASLELSEKKNLEKFKDWMNKEGAYVYTMNGFPFGNFHNTRVKEKVHYPDWTTTERVEYTVRLASILAELIPGEISGGISTSPLGYRHSFIDSESIQHEVFTKATLNVLNVFEHLLKIKNETSKTIHLDIEPEPDGLLETGKEFIYWFEEYLLPLGTKLLKQKYNTTSERAAELLKEHIRLCYDVCHFAIGYEDHATILSELDAKGIKIGKVQISAAIKADLSAISDRKNTREAFLRFNDSTYLHQVVAKKRNNTLVRYRDLPQALLDIDNSDVVEWRSHFHVPVFLNSFGILRSTQNEILDLLAIHNHSRITTHLEVETYTWDVLPDSLKLPIRESIVRELQWVKNCLNLQQQAG